MKRRAPVRAVPRGGVPVSLLLRACIEVWAEDPTASDAWRSARHRHSQARRACLEQLGLSAGQACSQIPSTGAPWSVEQLGYEAATVRFERAGCAIDDLPALIEEADALHAAAHHERAFA